MSTSKLRTRGPGEYSYRGWRIWKRGSAWCAHPGDARDFHQAQEFGSRAAAKAAVDSFFSWAYDKVTP